MKVISTFAIIIPLALSSFNGVSALKLPFEIYRREFSTTGKDSFAFGDAPAETVDNKMDVRYTTNITLNGKSHTVALDTGSTDLWVYVPGGIGEFNDSGIPVQINYGDGSYGVTGTIGVAPFQFSRYEVLKQAFLNVTNSTIKGFDTLGIQGILGLSFDFGTASRINAAVKATYGNSSTWGQSVLHNIFDQQPDQPNFIALSLSRTDDLEDTKGGSFTIGEYDPTYAMIAEEPELPQFPEGGTRWTTLLEGIYVDGKTIPLNSTLKGVPTGQGVALLDTGDPHAMFPTLVWDGIYSAIPGAEKYSEGVVSNWLVPCNTTTLVELQFGGKTYPLHPLDLTTISDPFDIDGVEGVGCVSAFRASDSFAVQGFEYSLGDSFLRNVYSAYHFGDSGSSGKPYMQLLSRIDPQNAISQVSTIRTQLMKDLPPEIPPATLIKLLKATPSSGPNDPVTTAKLEAANANSGVGSTSSSNDDSTSSNSFFGNGSIGNETVKKYGLMALVLLAVNVAIGLVLLAFAISNCVRRGSDKKRGRIGLLPATTSSQYAPVSVAEDDAVYSTHLKRYAAVLQPFVSTVSSASSTSATVAAVR